MSADRSSPNEGGAATPEVDAPQPAWRQRARGGRFGNGTFAWLARSRIGLALTPLLLFFVVLYFCFAAPKARRASFRFADQVGRGGSWWRRWLFAFRHFWTFGVLQVDRLAVLAGQDDLYALESDIDAAILAAHAEGRGVILQTAHLGNWQMTLHLLGQLGVHATAVMVDTVGDAVKEALARLEAERAFSVIYSDGSPNSAAAILAALQRGDVVGIMGDRLFGGEGVPVEFLGEPATLPVGGYVLSVVSGASLFHCFSCRIAHRRYRLLAQDVGRLKYPDRRRKREALQGWAQEFADRLGEVAEEYPTQWGNFHPLGADDAAATSRERTRSEETS
ncbi:MAG: hypothetical protein AAF488_01285 [Planctomycetota bacterium]